MPARCSDRNIQTDVAAARRIQQEMQQESAGEARGAGDVEIFTTSGWLWVIARGEEEGRRGFAQAEGGGVDGGGEPHCDRIGVPGVRRSGSGIGAALRGVRGAQGGPGGRWFVDAWR